MRFVSYPQVKSQITVWLCVIEIHTEIVHLQKIVHFIVYCCFSNVFMYERLQILTVSLLFDLILFIKQHFYRNESVLNVLILISSWSITDSYNH